MIALAGLGKIYRDGAIEVKALADVNLTIAKGEMVAIMGPSGSGKSTLLNILGCLDRPTAGSYRLNGREVATLSQRELARVRQTQLGFVFQSYHLLPRLTALQNVELPLAYAGVPGGRRRETAREALTKVGLEHRLSHRPRELSGGQQQRVAIARALVNQPKLILADEPTGNLDSRSSLEIMALFQTLHDAGITVALVTHEPDIAGFTQRIMTFHDGLIVSDSRIEQKRAGGKELASA